MTLDQQYTLKDARDNKEYTIARLKMTKDGSKTQCWMTQNLALNLSSSRTLKFIDTDLNSVTNWTPIRNTIATGNLNTTTWKDDNYTPYSYNSGRTDYGVYYNWSAAVASNNTSSMTAQYSNAPDSVCPRGWRLPQVYGGSSTNRPNEFGNLLYAYSIINNAFPGDNQNAGWATNGYTKIQQAPINFSVAGHINSGGFNGFGVYGHYWSSNIHSTANAYSLGFNNGVTIYSQNFGVNSVGLSVYCTLR